MSRILLNILFLVRLRYSDLYLIIDTGQCFKSHRQMGLVEESEISF